MVAQGSFAALLLGLAAVAEQIRDELGLSLAAVGAILAAPTFGSIATVLAWGALADRIGERAVIATGLGVAAVALAVTSFADDRPGAGRGPGGGRAVRGERERGERAGGGVVVPAGRAGDGARACGTCPRRWAARRRRRSCRSPRTPAGWRRRCWRWRRPGGRGPRRRSWGSAGRRRTCRTRRAPGRRRRAAAAGAARPGDLDGVPGQRGGGAGADLPAELHRALPARGAGLVGDGRGADPGGGAGGRGGRARGGGGVERPHREPPAAAPPDRAVVGDRPGGGRRRSSSPARTPWPRRAWRSPRCCRWRATACASPPSRR